MTFWLNYFTLSYPFCLPFRLFVIDSYCFAQNAGFILFRQRKWRHQMVTSFDPETYPINWFRLIYRQRCSVTALESPSISVCLKSLIIRINGLDMCTISCGGSRISLHRMSTEGARTDASRARRWWGGVKSDCRKVRTGQYSICLTRADSLILC